MEQLQQLLCIYFGIEILLCIYTLFKYTNCKNNVKKQRLVGRASRKLVSVAAPKSAIFMTAV